MAGSEALSSEPHRIHPSAQIRPRDGRILLLAEYEQIMTPRRLIWMNQAFSSQHLDRSGLSSLDLDGSGLHATGSGQIRLSHRKREKRKENKIKKRDLLCLDFAGREG